MGQGMRAQRLDNRHWTQIVWRDLVSGTALSIVLPSLCLSGNAMAQALPSGTVLTGNVAIVPMADTLDVRLTSNVGAVEWNPFNLGSTQTVNFMGPSANSLIVNAISQGSQSTIAGHVIADGQVILSNAAGIKTEASASFNVSGLTLTSLALDPIGFTNNYSSTLQGQPGDIGVINNGTISATGRVNVIGQFASNNGTIQAQDIFIGAGMAGTLNQEGDGPNVMLTGAVQATSQSYLVSNSGTLFVGTGGSITLEARDQNGIANAAVYNSGRIEARNGYVTLISSNGPLVNEGTVNASGGTVTFLSGSTFSSSDTIKASRLEGTSSGSVTITGTNTIDALGSIDVGGDFTLTNGSDLAQSDSLVVRGLTDIDAGSNDVILNHFGNKFDGAVSIKGGEINIYTDDGLTMGNIAGSTVVVDAASVTVTQDVTANTLTLGGASSVITQTAGTIDTALLNLWGASAQLTNAGNTVAALDTVNLTGNLSLTNSSALDIKGSVKASAISLKLGAGAITQTAGRITTAALALEGADANFGSASNEIEALGRIDLTGDLSIFNSRALAINDDVSANAVRFEIADGVTLGAGRSITAAQTRMTMGRLLANGIINGAVTIDPDATLAGSGTVGTTTINGMLSPGNSIGVMTVAGDLNFGAGSVYEVEVDSAGHADRTNITGSADIDPTARVKVLAENRIDDGSAYQPNRSYTILSTTTGVNGRFASAVEHDFAFLDAALAYIDNDVLLNLTLKNGTTAPDFGSVAETGNQAGVANALSSFDPSDPVIQELTGLSADQARNAYESISGESHASDQQMLDQTFALFNSAFSGGRNGTGSGGRMEAPLAYGPEPGTAVASLLAIDDAAAERAWRQTAWLKPLAGFGTVNATTNAAAADWWAAGLAGGYELEGAVNGGTGTFGLGLGYLASGSDVAARAASTKGLGGQTAVYGEWTDGTLAMSGSLAYAATHLSSRRDITVGAVNRTATAEYWSHAAGLSIETSYGMALDHGFTIRPVGAFNLGWSGHNGATETGAGSLNATLGAMGAWQAETGAGIALDYAMALENQTMVDISARALWWHEFSEKTPTQTISLAGGGSSFSVAGAAGNTDRLEFGAGLTLTPTDGPVVSLDYTGSASKAQTSHTASARLEMTF